VFGSDSLSRDRRLAVDDLVVVAGVRCCAQEGRSWQYDDSQLLGGERGLRVEDYFQAGADVRPISISEAAGLLMLGVFFVERLMILMS
jgi:hypothetical protein